MTTWRQDLVWSAAVTLPMLGPLLLGGGYWLVGDMVFVPEQPWKPAWLGLDTALPRAVPMDAIVSVLTQVVPGSWVQRGLLVGGFVLGGLGIGRLVGEQPWYARGAAITLLLWNPWVYERVLIGQWAILLGYLVLPWVALGARRFRADSDRGCAPLALALVAAAVCSPSSGLTALGVAGVLGLTREKAGWWRLVLVGGLANLTWLVPSLTADAVRVTAEGVFDTFAARGESDAGLLPSLLSMGGIWKTSILPAERTSAAVVLLACLLSATAVAGLRRAVRDQPGEWGRWLCLGGAALVLAALPALPGGTAGLEWAAEQVPGVAVLRDSHRFLAPLGVVLAVGVAGAAAAVRQRVRPGREALWSAVALLAVAPVLLLPSLAWGAWGELERAEYPAEWEQVASVLEDDPARTVVLPWTGSYRGFDWNHRRAVLDPAPRYFPGDVVVDDRVIVDDGVVPAEDPAVEEVRRALATEDPAAALRRLGVRWVLVEKDVNATEPALPPGVVRHDGEGLLLVDLAGRGEQVADRPEPPIWRTVAVAAGQGGSLVLLFAAAVVITYPRVSVSRPS